MADIRESFPTLENGSAEGVPLRSVQEGESVASKNGQLAFSFKDGSGNAIAAPVKSSGDAPGTAVPTLAAKDNAGNLVELPVKQAGQAPGDAVPSLGFRDSSGNLTQPQLNAAGQLPVTLATSGNGKYARGLATGSSTFVTVATITLANSKVYDDFDWLVSCFREAIFQLIWNNNGVETIIAEALTGSGSFSVHAAFKNMEITSGATGTQEILVKAKNLVAASLSDFRSTVSCNEG